MKQIILIIIFCLSSCIALNAQKLMTLVDYYDAADDDIPFFNDVVMVIIDEDCFVEACGVIIEDGERKYRHVADGYLKNFDISSFENGYFTVRDNHLLNKSESCLVEIYEKGKFVEVVNLPVAIFNYPDIQRYFLGRNEYGWSTYMNRYGRALCQFKGHWGYIYIYILGNKYMGIDIRLYDNSYPVDRYKAALYNNGVETIKESIQFVDRYTGEKFIDNAKAESKRK